MVLIMIMNNGYAFFLLRGKPTVSGGRNRFSFKRLFHAA